MTHYSRTIPVKRYTMIVLLSFGMAIMPPFALPIIAYGMVTSKESLAFEEYQVLIVLILCFVVGLNLAMWYTFGTEKVEINEKELIYTRSNRLFSYRRTFSLKAIQAIEINNATFEDPLKRSMSSDHIREQRRAWPFWWKMGRLTLVTKNKSVHFFNGLSGFEVAKAKCELEEAIQQA